MSEKWVIRNKLSGKFLEDYRQVDVEGARSYYWRWTDNTEPKLIFLRECDAVWHLGQSGLYEIAEVVTYE